MNMMKYVWDMEAKPEISERINKLKMSGVGMYKIENIVLLQRHKKQLQSFI